MNLRVTPNSAIYAPQCVVSGLDASAVAGTALRFEIQARDFYSNNLAILATSLTSKNVTLYD